MAPITRLQAAACTLEEFAAVVSEPTDPAGCPTAVEIISGVPCYRSQDVAAAAVDPDGRAALLVELAAVLRDGPGIAMFRAAVEPDAVAAASAVFRRIIADQRSTGADSGDHFAPPGANDRIWNALEKLALADPEVFAAYYRSPVIALVSEAWLGPGYQVTSQVNVVNPGGRAQQPHRDYHLGFMTDDRAERFLSHIHEVSPLLTLQGAVAHGEMPVETGPTKYLPHSQRYGAGYLAWRRPEFIEYFEANHVQLPLSDGDAVFFNPALFHAAGHNRTSDVRRMANLLQVSSPMARAMEAVDRRAMTLALYPVLAAAGAEARADGSVDRVIAASSEGYPFPADLDRQQPVDGLAPPSQADLVRLALEEGWSIATLAERLNPSEPAVTR